VSFMWKENVNWIQAIFFCCILFVGYFPNLFFKYFTFGIWNLLDNVRPTDQDIGYCGKLIRYVSLDRLMSNVTDVFVYSGYHAGDRINRLALLQANPWFCLAPAGLPFLRGKSVWLRWFVAVSFLFALFYLSGENMSAQKLKFHCLRYISFF